MAQQDAVLSDPRHYQVVAEDDRVRVLRARYGGGEKSSMHSHPAVVAVFLTDGQVRFTSADGSTQEAQCKAGDTMLMEATTHSVENLGQSIEAIVVELKG